MEVYTGQISSWQLSTWWTVRLVLRVQRATRVPPATGVSFEWVLMGDLSAVTASLPKATLTSPNNPCAIPATWPLAITAILSKARKLGSPDFRANL